MLATREEVGAACGPSEILQLYAARLPFVAVGRDLAGADRVFGRFSGRKGVFVTSAQVQRSGNEGSGCERAMYNAKRASREARGNWTLGRRVTWLLIDELTHESDVHIVSLSRGIRHFLG